MKKLILLATILGLQLAVFAQDMLIKDIDLDGKKDSIYIDQKEWKIVCRLSTQNFKKIKSSTVKLHKEEPP